MVTVFYSRILPEAVQLQLSPSAAVSLPARQVVLLSTYAMGRDERNFPEPELFWPGRWDREEDKEGKRKRRLRGVREAFAWMPFGFGPRACVGRAMAMQQMTYFIV